MKEEWMNRQEEERDRELADILGITYDELQQTEWEFDENASNDGLVYDLLVKFDESSPKEILAKIKGLDETNTVWLDPNVFNNRKHGVEEDEE